jgi:acetolactate synthase-1/2/3 large subunit
LAAIGAERSRAGARDIQNLPDDRRLHAAHVMHDLWRETRGQAIVVTDVGQHQMWEAQYYRHERPRSLITSGGLGTMGFALPAAIGAKLARPETEVWVVAGDGGFQMTGAELATVAQERLPLRIAVVNNGYLGMVRQWQEFFYGKRYCATPISGPDFCKLAEAYSIAAARVASRAEVVPAIRAARRHDGPILIDFRVEREDAVYPMVPAGASLDQMLRRPRPAAPAGDAREGPPCYALRRPRGGDPDALSRVAALPAAGIRDRVAGGRPHETDGVLRMTWWWRRPAGGQRLAATWPGCGRHPTRTSPIALRSHVTWR